MEKKGKVISVDDLKNLTHNRQKKIMLDSISTLGDVYLVQGIMEKGSEVQVHIHELEDEIFHVLEGQVELTLGDEKIEGNKGDVIYLPRGVKHGIKTKGEKTARVLNYVIPGANLEEYFRKMDQLKDPDEEEIEKISLEHKIRFL